MIVTKEGAINYAQRISLQVPGPMPDEDGWYIAVEPDYDGWGICRNFWMPGVTPCGVCGLLITHKHAVIT